jgi:hypothetical protein
MFSDLFGMQGVDLGGDAAQGLDTARVCHSIAQGFAIDPAVLASPGSGSIQRLIHMLGTSRQAQADRMVAVKIDLESRPPGEQGLQFVCSLQFACSLLAQV